MSDPKKIRILWLEDRPASVSAEMGWARIKMTVKCVATLPNLYNTLLEWKDNPQQNPITAIVLDIQLFAVTDLRPFINDDAIHFLPNEAGWKIAEEILRADGSHYQKIPLLVYTVQIPDDDDRRRLEILRVAGGAEIHMIEKKSGMDVDINFINWINRVVSNQIGGNRS